MDRARSFLPVDLASAEAFLLGGLEVRPAQREVELCGARRRLERRVMQVLVALAHPTWEVVTREELTDRCWNGLCVSEDAIHRCIAALRRLAALWPEPPFEIETIHRVGYLLKAAERRVSPTGPHLVWPPARRASDDRWQALERQLAG